MATRTIGHVSPKTTKEEAIRQVLTKRAGILKEFLVRIPEEKRDYYSGKLEGYRQALELLSDDVGCITVELDDNDTNTKEGCR